MSDPYREATRTVRRGLPTYAKVGLIAGGLFALGLATLVAVGVWMLNRLSGEDAERLAVVVAEFAELEKEFLELEADGAKLRLAFDADELQERVEEARADAREATERARRVRLRMERGALHRDGRVVVDGRVRVTPSEDGLVVEVDARESGVVQTTRDGSFMSFGEADRAVDLPDWVPVHPEANASTRRRATAGKDADGSFGMSELEAEASGADVLRWYRSALADAGFERPLSVGAKDGDPNSGFIVAAGPAGSRLEGRTISVMVEGAGDSSAEVLLAYRN